LVFTKFFEYSFQISCTLWSHPPGGVYTWVTITGRSSSIPTRGMFVILLMAETHSSSNATGVLGVFSLGERRTGLKADLLRLLSDIV